MSEDTRPVPSTAAINGAERTARVCVSFKSWSLKDAKFISRKVYFEYNYTRDDLYQLTSTLIHATEMPESLLYPLVNQLRDTVNSIRKEQNRGSVVPEGSWNYPSPAPFIIKATGKNTTAWPYETQKTAPGSQRTLRGGVNRNDNSEGHEPEVQIVNRSHKASTDDDIIIVPYNESLHDNASRPSSLPVTRKEAGMKSPVTTEGKSLIHQDKSPVSPAIPEEKLKHIEEQKQARKAKETMEAEIMHSVLLAKAFEGLGVVTSPTTSSSPPSSAMSFPRSI